MSLTDTKGFIAHCIAEVSKTLLKRAWLTYLYGLMRIAKWQKFASVSSKQWYGLCMDSVKKSSFHAVEELVACRLSTHDQNSESICHILEEWFQVLNSSFYHAPDHFFKKFFNSLHLCLVIKSYLTRLSLKKDHLPPLAHLLDTLAWQELSFVCTYPEKSEDAMYVLDNSIWLSLFFSSYYCL